MKVQVKTIEAIPSKRIYWSIIADYNLNTSICELIDNAIDMNTKNPTEKSININIDIDSDQQSISVFDNAGGVKENELGNLISPGQTGNNNTGETIGIFGVGTKRAVVALAQDIKITSRFSSDKTFRLEYDDEWLNDDSWEISVYQVDNIPEGSTKIELSKLRYKITDEHIQNLKEHLSAIYALFIEKKIVIIKINSEIITPTRFEKWAFPPGFEPREYYSTISPCEGINIKVKVLAGLTTESSPSGEYGVYFYCNNRLVARELKTYEVGYTKGVAGSPHPNISLTRVIVFLNGDSRYMPWNSSKSDISANNQTFILLRDWLIGIVKDYSSLSRRLEGEWPEKVFKYTTGTIKKELINDLVDCKKSYLPPLPVTRPRYIDTVKHENKTVVKDKPWTRGLYENIIAVDLILKNHLEMKNNISLILLDSTIEIAFKEYLVNGTTVYYSDDKLVEIFKSRKKVEGEIRKYILSHDDILWGKINYYHNLRNKLIHERASASISDKDIVDCREAVENVLKTLFGLKFFSSTSY